MKTKTFPITNLMYMSGNLCFTFATYVCMLNSPLLLCTQSHLLNCSYWILVDYVVIKKRSASAQIENLMQIRVQNADKHHVLL